MTLLAPTLEAFFTQHAGRPPAGQPPHHRLLPRHLGGCSSATPWTRQARLPPASTSPPSTPGWSAASSPTWSRSGATPPGRATRDWPRSGRSSSSPPCATPSTPRRSPRVLAIPAQEARPGLRLLPHRRRDQGPPRRTRLRHLDRPPRPCHDQHADRPHRAAHLRAPRPDPLRRPRAGGRAFHVRCTGKGRRERSTPLDPARRSRDETGPGKGKPRPARRAAVPRPRPHRAGRCPRTPSRPASPNTTRSQPRTARRWPRRKSPRTPSGTPRPWPCCTPASTSPSSPSGSATFQGI